jgi:hypothetical protein
MSQPIDQRITALADKIRPLLGAEDVTIAMSALALLSGEALGSIRIAPQFTRAVALQLYCQQVSDLAAKIEDQQPKY